MSAESLGRSRLDSFSDGVIAVIITIMVLELKVPSTHEMSTRDALRLDARISAIYLLSFVQTGIYWVNHHYLMDDLEHISHGVLWANLGFLFCLSLIPFGTQWIGVRGIEPAPVALYAVCFVLASVAWLVLSNTVCSRTRVQTAAGPAKQTISAVTNVAAIGVAFYSPVIALLMIAAIAGWWMIAPPRVRQKMHAPEATKPA